MVHFVAIVLMPTMFFFPIKVVTISSTPSCPPHTLLPGKLLILPLPLRLLRGTVIGGRWAENQFRSVKKTSIQKFFWGQNYKKKIFKDLMGLVGLEKLAWLEAADSSDSRRVGSYGSSPGSKGMLGRKHENNIKKKMFVTTRFLLILPVAKHNVTKNLTGHSQDAGKRSQDILNEPSD